MSHYHNYHPYYHCRPLPPTADAHFLTDWIEERVGAQNLNEYMLSNSIPEAISFIMLGVAVSFLGVQLRLRLRLGHMPSYTQLERRGGVCCEPWRLRPVKQQMGVCHDG